MGQGVHIKDFVLECSAMVTSNGIYAFILSFLYHI